MSGFKPIREKSTSISTSTTAPVEAVKTTTASSATNSGVTSLPALSVGKNLPSRQYQIGLHV